MACCVAAASPVAGGGDADIGDATRTCSSASLASRSEDAGAAGATVEFRSGNGSTLLSILSSALDVSERLPDPVLSLLLLLCSLSVRMC